jgi:ACS family hexuronate transporter-like MFS transporter
MRWWVLTLLTLATVINYLDRIVFAVLSPVIREELKFNNEQYGYINGAFQIAYTLGFLVMGKFIDIYGTRIGYGLSVAWWSLAACLHPLSTTSGMLAFWRAMLGLGEAGNFPAAIKSVAEWFPARDRAVATGIFNAGTNLASMIGPPLFYWMQAHYGWRACFLITGGMGFVWLIAWMTTYRLPRQPIEVEAGVPKVGWAAALTMRETWGFAGAKFFSDPVWWFYLYWLPPYFYDVRKMDLKSIGWALPVIYLTADIGSVGGGWLSGWMMRRGWPAGKARKATMLICASLMPFAALSVLADSPITAIALISLATSAHQGWSANLYTTVSDVFPRNATASVTGIGGCVGGLGGVLFSAFIPGFVVERFGYTPVFLTMGCFHLIGWFIAHKLMGDMKKVSGPEIHAEPRQKEAV